MDVSNTREPVLYIKTFGGFSVRWRGHIVTGEPWREGEPPASLLQTALHFRETGISRSQLKEIFSEGLEEAQGKEILDSMLRDAARCLRECGLPDVEFFEWHGDMLYWTPQVAVREDASEFERLCTEAKNIREREARLKCLLRACELYKGEFLAGQTGMMWVVREAWRYRTMFCACADEAAALLRAAGDYERLEKLGISASNAQPLADWETLTLEALLARKRTEDAWRFYDRTVDFYERDAGLRPPERMLDMLENTKEQFSYGYAALDRIQADLEEPLEEVKGGYVCPFPVFQSIYRMVARMMERGGQSVHLMLCSLTDENGAPVKDGDTAERMSARLLEAVRAAVRHGDAVSRCGRDQCIVLLINTTREDCALIQKRVSRGLAADSPRIRAEYRVRSVVCPADRC